MQMIVGLGNPGKEYADTRHNVGFKVIDMLSETFGMEIGKRSFGARLGKGKYCGKEVMLFKPWQYMNRSGQPVADVVGFYKVNLSDMLVVLDDMWLEPGQIRLREKGSDGGHNGLADIIEKLGTDQFNRLRIGIGSRNEMTGRDYVLSKPDETEKKLIDKAIADAADAVMVWINEGIESAMSRFNRKLTADKNEE
jgi:PTH1 family peptidyl-tRNA hydrolase